MPEAFVWPLLFFWHHEIGKDYIIIKGLFLVSFNQLSAQKIDYNDIHMHKQHTEVCRSRVSILFSFFL